MEKSREKRIREYDKRQKKMLLYGIKHKLVFTYPDVLFDRLRPYQVGGFPASILLFIIEMCNGKCYDRSLLMQLAFEDCQIVHADIESLRVTYDKGSPEHSFVVTRQFGGNKEWVVDTSIGLIYDKDYYYKFEKPKVNRIFSKKECMDFIQTKDIIAGDFNQDKYALPLYLPFIEKCVKNSVWLGTIMYREKILFELELFKKAINYDGIVREINEDMKLMKTDPAKLDEKFKIVRDKYGREISRNGVMNPYYVSFEESERREKYFDSIKDDEKKVKEYWDEIVKRSISDMELEEEKVSRIAEKRLEKILNNPTANFYDNCIYSCQDICKHDVSKRK